MDHQRIPADRPVRIVVIGAGNRAHKYLEYARRHPERLQPVAIVETNDLRRNELADRFGVAESGRYNDYNDFFSRPVAADAVLIATPENIHFDPCMKAVEAGYHILLEKPIAQSYDECRAIARQARKRGVLVGICHVLRYHPYFVKIKQIIDSGELGEIISINHVSAVGIDRATHGYVRGLWRRAEATNPMLLAKCCHDVDFLLWITGSPCRKISSFGSLRWFRTANAPQGSTERCIDCPVESNCPYSAVDLYCNRRDWISNFDVPHGKSLDEVLMEELKQGPYGRCVYRCDNNVVDHQLLTMELENETILSLSMDVFTQDDCRRTHIKMTHGEIFGDEKSLHVRRFRSGSEQICDFEKLAKSPFHAGADLRLIEDFVDALTRPGHPFRTAVEESIESHRICFEAERSRLSGKTILLQS